MSLSCAIAPGAWGVEDPADPSNPDWEQVLDEMGGAGYAGTELGPYGYLPIDAGALADALERRGLQLVAGFLMKPLQDAEQWKAIEESAVATCELLAALGARTLIVIDALESRRVATAGRIAARAHATEEQWLALTGRVNEIAHLARDRFGVDVAFHPHAGTAVEFRDEIERLLAHTDPRLVGLCVDSGHCAYAGIDPIELCERHGDRVRYLHLKDVDAEVLSAVLGGGLGFWEAVGAGVFCPLGSGVVDFRALKATVDRIGYSGWATVEQDRLPGQTSSPMVDARASVAHLRSVGLVNEPERIP